MMLTTIKTYSECIKFSTFNDRFEYLNLSGKVGEETFGSNRYLNQILYSSGEWKKFRRDVIIRDDGLDMACEGYDIYERAVVHHINPITIEDVINRSPSVFDFENVILVSPLTHKAIHYGNIDLLMNDPIERYKNDTCPWRHN